MPAHFAPPFDLVIVGATREGTKHLTTLTSYVVPQVNSILMLPAPSTTRYVVDRVTYDFDKGCIGIDVSQA